jgi:hypothetical protein
MDGKWRLIFESTFQKSAIFGFLSCTLLSCGRSHNMVLVAKKPKTISTTSDIFRLSAESAKVEGNTIVLNLVAKGKHKKSGLQFACVRSCPKKLSIDQKSGTATWPLNSAALENKANVIEFFATDGLAFASAIVNLNLNVTINNPNRVPACAADGQLNCLATNSFPAVDKQILIPSVLKNGSTVAGVAGNYPSLLNPLAGWNTLDGQADLPSFDASAISAGSYQYFKRDGTRVSGNITVPNLITPSRSTQSFHSSTSLYGGFDVAGDTNLDSDKIIAGTSIFGLAGNVMLPSTSAVRTGNSFGPAGASTGTLADCSTDGAVGCVSSASFKAADMSLLVNTNIKNGVSIAGVTGNYPSSANRLTGDTVTTDLTSMAASTAAGSYEFWDSIGTRYTGNISDAATLTPTTSNQNFTASLYRQFSVSGDANLVAGNIRSGAAVFGVSGTVVPGTNCTADGQTGCLTTSTYISADTNAISGWDLRIGKTFGGVSGGLKFCRNQINTSVYNYTGQAYPLNLDSYGTIDDYNNSNPGMPGTIVSGWSNYTCGASNWQDISTTGTRCASGGGSGADVCQMRDLLTMQIWSPLQAAQTWSNAISTCNSMTYGAVAAGTWRLPTLNESLTMTIDGLASIETTTFGTKANIWFNIWTSTTQSNSTANVFLVDGSGWANIGDKSTSNQFFCVR